jgi:cellulose synthase/poly-beta-1,6-N-acetylglucosamine synthase-like glycosyltransferase
MKWLYYIFLFIQGIFILYLILPILILIFHYFRKVFYRYISPINRKPIIDKNFNFVAIVTAHQDIRFIAPLVDSLVKQTYRNVKIFVVADDCDTTSLHFDDERVKILSPEQPFHSKIKSIGLAVDNFSETDDVMVIFDSDNLVHPKYFDYLNKYFQQGYFAVQTHMLSKNIESVYARLDSIGHIFYTFLEREMRMEMGLSSNILGLGIALDIPLYKKIKYKDNLGGFDKNMQAQLLKGIPQLAFAKEAIVYDEKVDDGATLEKQRTRWLFTFVHYFKITWDIFVTGLKRFDVKLTYIGYVSLRPPLIFLMSISLFFAAVNYFINPFYSLIWIACIFLFVLGFILIIATQSVQKGMVNALLYVPLVLFRQVKALLKIKAATTSFLKTEHNKVLYINELVKDETV